MGILQKDTGEEPFDAPANQLAAIEIGARSGPRGSTTDAEHCDG